MRHPPYLLLDVDGVLNPFPGPSGSLPPRHRPHRVTYRGEPGIPLWLRPEHGTWITALRSMGLVHPVWATSWEADADRAIGPRLGLAPMDHIDFGPDHPRTRHPNGYLWKRDTVAIWAERRPLAWIDDDFTPLDHTWAKDRADSGAPTLLIQPDPYQGLQREHIDAVRTWAIAVLHRENEERRTGDVPRPRTAAPVHPLAHTPRLHGSR
ncbi:HAD domain-containing protein [Nocardiopsis protaetiae]|uniref:HAD domain-containing protein n=1 Tax=Nocardiopsis protaetiae TaxID=3382270 RepID=UPI00387AD034